MDIVLREEAIADLEEIGDYIALDNPVRARSFVARIKARCLAIGRNPMAARLRPQWGVGVRGIVFKRYLIAYRVEGDEVLILRVIHGARDIERLMS